MPVRTPESNRTASRSPTASTIRGRAWTDPIAAVAPAAAVVGDHDAVETAPGRELRVLRGLDSPQEDRAVPALADPPQRPPAPAGARGRDQQMGVAGGAGAPQRAQVQIAVPGPVQLVPARSRAVRGGDLFDGVAGPRRLDVRELQVGGSAGAGQFPVWMSQLLAPHRREDDRRRHAGPEDGRGQVALRPVDEHPRDDPPTPKRSRIRACSLARLPRRPGSTSEPGGRAPWRLGPPAWRDWW